MTSPKIARKRLIWALAGGGGAAVVSAIVVILLTRSAGSSVDPEIASDASTAETQPPPDRPALPTDKPGTGAHTLTGGVYDVAGAPVQGAVITAELELGPGDESMAMASGLSTTAVVVAVSKADGAFALVGLDAGRYRLRVEGEAIFTAEVRFVDVPSNGMRLVVARQVDVRGFVVEEGGDPVADIVVSLVGEARDTLVSTATDGDGAFVFEQLPEGVFTVWASAGDRAAPAVSVHRLGAGPFDTVELRLGPAAIVTGQVIDRVTRRGVAAAAGLRAIDGAEPPRYGRSDADGNFRVEGVPLARWSADAFSPGYVTTEAIGFAVGGSFSPTIELQPGAMVAGRVVDLHGTAIAGAIVSLRGKDTRGHAISVDEQWQRDNEHTFSGRAGRSTSSAADPRFIARGELGVLLGPIPFPPPPGAATLRVASIVDEDGVGDPDAPVALAVHPDKQSTYLTDPQGRFVITGAPAGAYRMLAAHPDYASFVGTNKRVLAVGQQVQDVEIVLVPGVVISGLVSNQRGEPIVGAAIIADLAGDELSRIQAITGTDGRYELGAIASNVSLRVTAVDHGDATRTLALGARSPDRVDRSEDFTLIAADATVAGRIVDASGFPVREAVVTIVSRDRTANRKSGITDDTGRFEIARLAPGTWTIEVNHLGFPSIEVALSTGADASVTLPFGGGIDAEIHDAHTNGPLAGARVVATGPKHAARESAADEQGAVELTPLAPGAWTLAVTAPGYVAQRVKLEVVAGTAPKAITVRDVRIEMQRGAVVGGTVRDAYGVRVRGAIVISGDVKAKTDEEGMFELRDVATGDDVVIRASRDGAIGTATINLAPGDEVATLDISLE